MKISHEDDIRKEIDRLTRMRLDDLKTFAGREQEVSSKRLKWWKTNHDRLTKSDGAQEPVLDRAYRIFYLEYLGLDPEEVPIIEQNDYRLVIRSTNFCPVHTACEALGLDTRDVCRLIYEQPVTDLLRQIDARLQFSRNYQAIRPHSAYCEEMITLTTGDLGH